MAKPTLEVVWPRRFNGTWKTWCLRRHQTTLTLILSHPGEETLEDMSSYFRPAALGEQPLKDRSRFVTPAKAGVQKA